METTNTKKTNEQLTNIFTEVGKKYGYDNVSAKFVPSREFKVKWQRTYKWADFKVADYLECASPLVLRDLAETLFAKIGNGTGKYSERFKRLVCSKEFAKKYQPKYLARNKDIHRTGKCHNLDDSLNRLIGSGLIKDDGTIIRWAKLNGNGASDYSTLFRVIKITDRLDIESAPDYVVDYVVYRTYLKSKTKRANFGKTGVEGEAETIKNGLKKFKDSKKAEKWIDDFRFRLD